MRRKLVDQRYKLPYFVANPISRIGEPQANEDDVDTAAEIITNYLQTDHDGYVRPLHILVCGANPRAVKAVVERMTYWHYFIGYIERVYGTRQKDPSNSIQWR